MTPSTTDVSLFRLYLLRATYLLIAVGLGPQIWPGIFHHVHPWTLNTGVEQCLLAALTALALLGVRYPLAMLPLLFFELFWKALWLIVVGWPAWSSGTADAATSETIFACSLGIIVPIVLPWSYIYANYVKKPGDRWR